MRNTLREDENVTREHGHGMESLRSKEISKLLHGRPVVQRRFERSKREARKKGGRRLCRAASDEAENIMSNIRARQGIKVKDLTTAPGIS